MKISYFKEFIALSKCLNYSLAATHLNMTQPGLTRHIAALENELGVKLFSRDTHQVKLTDSGELFLRGIEKIIEDYETLCESILMKNTAKLTIGIPYYGINRYLSPIVSLFEAAHAQIKIDYLPAYPDEIIMGLLSGKVDVAILPKVDYPDFSTLVFHFAFKESVVVMMNKNHPLSSKKELKLRDIADQEFISLKGDFGEDLFKKLCEFCNQFGFSTPRKVEEADSIEVAALKMRPDAGIMFLPGHFMQTNISGNVNCIKIVDENCYLEVSLVRSSTNDNPAIDKFIHFYLKELLKVGE